MEITRHPKPRFPVRATLRERAERVLRTDSSRVAIMSRDEVQKLVHELQVHQIELEMQNEELLRAQAELAESRDRYRDLYDFAPVGYVTTDLSGRIRDTNLTAARLLGVERGWLVGKKISRFVARECQDDFHFHQMAVRDNGDKQFCELQLRREDGSNFPALLETVYLKSAGSGENVCRSVISDVSLLRRTEHALDISEDLNRKTLQALPALIVVIDGQGRILVLNEAWTRFAAGNGANDRPGMAVGANYLEVCRRSSSMNDADAGKALAGIQEVLSGRKRQFAMEYACRGPREQRWFLMNVVPLGARGGEGAVITHLDITERKLAEENLRELNLSLEDRVRQRTSALIESEQRIRTLVETVTTGIITMDQRGRIESINSAGLKMFGCVVETVRGKNIGRLLCLPGQPPGTRFGPELMRALENQTVNQVRDVLKHNGNDRAIALEWKLTEFTQSGRTKYVLVVQDVTERKRLEHEILAVGENERRRIAQDLHDGLGQLLSGTLHLAGTLENELAAGGHSQAANAGRIFNLIKEAVTQTRTLARGLHPVHPEPNGLMVALKSLASHTSSLFGCDCRFNCARPVQMENLNTATHLYRIAQEAVTNAIKHGRAKRVRISLTQTPQRVRIAIRDNGNGLMTRRRAKGMGLHIMRYRAGIIGGSLAIEKRPNGGTTVVCTVHQPAPNRRMNSSDGASQDRVKLSGQKKRS